MMDEEHVTNMLIVSEGINFVDLAGAEMLVELSDILKARGGGLYFCNLKSSVFNFIAHVGFINRIGEKPYLRAQAGRHRPLLWQSRTRPAEGSAPAMSLKSVTLPVGDDPLCGGPFLCNEPHTPVILGVGSFFMRFHLRGV